MSGVGNISMSGSISGATTITASGLIKTTNYLQGTRLYLTDSVYLEYDSATLGVKLVGAGFWTESYVAAGGTGSGSGGGGGTDLARVWESLTNNTDFPNVMINPAHIPGLSWSKITSGLPTTLSGYGITDAYTKAQVDSLIGAINQFHYEIYASTSAVANPQANVLYLIGPTGSGSDKYEEYIYASSTWTKIGDTSIDLTPYLTKNLAASTYQPIISDLATIRNNAANGNTAYNSLTTVSLVLQSLQSQIDSVATRDCFDELTATVFFSSTAAVTNLYAESISLGGKDLSGTLASLGARATTLEGYFTNGVANSALRLTTVSKTAWGQTYWTADGVPDNVSGNMSGVGNISMSGSISGATTITASGLIKTTNYLQGTRLYLTDSVYLEYDSATLGVKLVGAGFWTESYVAAGGVGESSGGGDLDIPRMWQSLTNSPADQGYENTKIAIAHIPDIASTYGYLKSNQTITLTGVVTGSGSTSITTSIADGALSIAKVSGLQAALDSKTGNTGTVTSVALSVPTGLSVSGSPITTSGTLAITFASGYSIPTTAQQTAWSGKQDTISDLATIRSNASHGETAYGWGNHAIAGYLTSANGVTISDCLKSLQSQIDSVATRSTFDELGATVFRSDIITASIAYIEAITASSASITSISGSLSGNATTASYLVSTSYGVGGGLNPVYFSGGRPVASASTAGSASIPVYMKSGTLTAITPSSMFSVLSSGASTNLSVTIAGLTKAITLYATYDSSGEIISDKFGIVSDFLQSLQSQVDSVATRNTYDELYATVLYVDTLSIGSNLGVGGALSISGATTLGSTLSVTGATTLSSSLSVSGATTISNTLTVGTSTVNRATTLYGSLTVSGDLALASSSHIDIGPLRIEYDSTNKALHVTKKSSADTETYSLYADGFVAAGGIGSGSSSSRWVGTQAQYDALGTYDDNVEYLIIES